MMKHILLAALFSVLTFSLTWSQDWDSYNSNDPDPNAFIIVDVEPAPLNIDEVKQLIGYPERAIQSDIEGKVVVRVLVDENGNYRSHIVLKDPHPILTHAVEAQLPKLHFSIGMKDDQPLKVWVTMPFDFKLTRESKRGNQRENAEEGMVTTVDEALRDPMAVKNLMLEGVNDLPSELGQCKNANIVFLYKCGLSRVPDWVKELKSLELLYLEGNQLENLPDWISTMPNLQAIAIGDNHFSKATLKKLKKAGDKNGIFIGTMEEIIDAGKRGKFD